MPKAIDIHLSQLRFPSTCVVCSSPATKAYTLHKTLIHGRSSYTVRVNVPMCDLHFHSASQKGAAEKWIHRFGAVAGILAGLVAIILLLCGEAITQGNLLLHLFAPGILATPIYLMVWAIISLIVAPLFAETASKEARDAVRLVRYWPKDQFVRLKFQDEQLADIVQNTYHPPSSSKSFKLMSRTPGF